MDTEEEKMCSWSGPLPGWGIPGNNVDRKSDVDLDACQVACEANSACKSIDWNQEEKKCMLNGVTDEEVDLGQYPKYSYFEKHCDGKLNKHIFSDPFIIQEKDAEVVTEER